MGLCMGKGGLQTFDRVPLAPMSDGSSANSSDWRGSVGASLDSMDSSESEGGVDHRQLFLDA